MYSSVIPDNTTSINDDKSTVSTTTRATATTVSFADIISPSETAATEAERAVSTRAYSEKERVSDRVLTLQDRVLTHRL